jgi:hypothetical protein
MGIYSKYKLGMDVSVYQQTVDYKRLAAEGLDFVIARTGKGTQVDTKFAYHCQGSYDAKLPFFGYHVPDPSITADPNMDRDKTFLAMVYALQNKIYAGLIADCEIKSYLNEAGQLVTITNTNLSIYYSNFANQCIKFLKGEKSFELYSSVGFIQSYMPAFNDQIIKYDAFMAEYPYPLGDKNNLQALKTLADLQVWIDKLETLYGGGKRGPLVPSTCKQNRMIQFSGDHFTHPAVLGATGQPSACDFDLFIGSDDEWDAFIHKDDSVVVVPTLPVTPDEPVTNPDTAELELEVAALSSRVGLAEAKLAGIKAAL